MSTTTTPWKLYFSSCHGDCNECSSWMSVINYLVFFSSSGNNIFSVSPDYSHLPNFLWPRHYCLFIFSTNGPTFSHGLNSTSLWITPVSKPAFFSGPLLHFYQTVSLHIQTEREENEIHFCLSHKLGFSSLLFYLFLAL